MANPKKSKEIGKKGEMLAVNFLKELGFTLLATNYHSKYGEIDIIATHPPDHLHFFEVKTRSPNSMNRPEESITYQKKQRLIKTALTFLQKTNTIPIKSWRISLISILLKSAWRSSRPQIEIIDIY
jgi:putative endonuclease